MNLKPLYRDDLLNRFASHTFTETVINDHIKVEFKDGASVVIAVSTKLVVADAYKNIREQLVSPVDAVMFRLSTTQRDAIPSPDEGNPIHNITTDEINVWNGTIWTIIGGGVVSVFGTEFEFFQSLAQSNTGAVSTFKLNVTTALKPIGTYRTEFNVDVTNNDGTDIIDAQFLVDGVAIHQHANGGDLYQNKPDGNNDWMAYSSKSYIDLVAPATIDLAIKFGTNDNTARASNATIEIWRVS